MLVIGLTGGIASGKSTVSNHLAKLGAIIIDADKIARDIVEPGQPALDRIAETFGSGILQEDGTLNRAALGQLVFSQPEARERLEGITGPVIFEQIRDKLAALRQQPDADKLTVVLDAPLLLEAGLTPLVDCVWVVAVSGPVQLQRLMERNGLTREQALDRISSQMPLEQKLTLADKVIWNDGSIANTLNQVDQLWTRNHGI